MNLTWDDDRADPFLTIFDPNNSVVVSQGGAQPIQVSFTATITGVYVFQLQNLGNRKADYDLQITHPVGSPPPSDTAAPTVIVTSPAAGSTVEGTVTIAASAWDNDTVTQVQFFVNGVLLSSDISVPYVATWDTTTMANGAHTITAQATDLSSNVGSSAPANVTVDNGAAPPDTTPPTTSITGPAVGATVSASITISATASDDVGVTQVQFFVDGVLLSTDTTGPYSASWNTTSALDGAHSLAAEASDAAGNSATSAAVNVTVDNTAPAVNITSPAAGATVSATVTITADASDSSGVTQVQFFVDGALLSSDSTAPYSASWDTTATANGTHSLSAQATDGQGNVGASETVNVTVSNVDATPPTVNITSPTNGATVGGTIIISAAASDNEVVTQVQFFVDGVLLSMDMTAPYSASWNTTPAADGVHSLTAQASDASGNVGTSAAVNVTVDNTGPAVSVTSPANGSTVTGLVTISADASDSAGVTQVQFFVDGVLLATDTTAPYSASWDATAASDGAHSLTAEATDSVGNVGLSGPVSVTVDNTAPAVNITSPAAGATVSATVTITADASDSSGVTQVQFFVDGALLSSDSTAPYSASWDTTATANGAHSLSAQATDGQGNVGASETVNVTVSNVDATPPTVNITSPTNGATVGGTITISAAASDNEVVTQVQFLVDGVLLSMDMTAPYSASWDTTPAADGVHSLTAEASDAAGNTGTSAVINVTVDNSTPPAPELSLSLSGVPASIDRGDEFTARSTVTNTGAATATGLTVTVSWSPGQMLRLENPTPSQSVGSVATGSSSNVSWLFRGDKEGSGTITVTLEDSGGATVDVITQSITVIK